MKHKKDHQLCEIHRLRVSLPKVRVFQEDELALLNKKDRIYSVDDLSEHHSPQGYTYH